LEVFLGRVVFFYSGSIFESQEIFDKQNYFSDDHEYQYLKPIPHIPAIIESKTCFSQNPIVRNSIGSAFKMAMTVRI